MGDPLSNPFTVPGPKRPTPQHGTNARYQRHLIAGEDPCDPCREAHRAYGQRRSRAGSDTYRPTPEREPGTGLKRDTDSPPLNYVGGRENTRLLDGLVGDTKRRRITPRPRTQRTGLDWSALRVETPEPKPETQPHEQEEEPAMPSPSEPATRLTIAPDSHVRTVAPESHEPRTIDLVATIERGRRSPHKRTATLAEKIHTDLKRLHDRLREEHERDEAEAEIHRLQKKLDAARAKVKGSRPAGTSAAKAIRAWAAENGVECPAMGRIPRAVAEAYEAAQS